VATLLVSDTSVLVDLERGGILETFFKLPFDIGVRKFCVLLIALVFRASLRYFDDRQINSARHP
jgi:hypothetical protein